MSDQPTPQPQPLSSNTPRSVAAAILTAAIIVDTRLAMIQRIVNRSTGTLIGPIAFDPDAEAPYDGDSATGLFDYVLEELRNDDPAADEAE